MISISYYILTKSQYPINKTWNISSQNRNQLPIREKYELKELFVLLPKYFIQKEVVRIMACYLLTIDDL